MEESLTFIRIKNILKSGFVYSFRLITKSGEHFEYKELNGLGELKVRNFFLTLLSYRLFL